MRELVVHAVLGRCLHDVHAGVVVALDELQFAAVYVTYKLLDIADLTVDGSFALGGSVCAALRQKSQISSH